LAQANGTVSEDDLESLMSLKKYEGEGTDPYYPTQKTKSTKKERPKKKPMFAEPENESRTEPGASREGSCPFLPSSFFLEALC